MRKLTLKLNFEYSMLHATYWMYYGIICSFASVFLLGRDFNNSQIGMILAIGNIIAVIVQPVLADITDRKKGISVFGVINILSLLIILSEFLLMPKFSKLVIGIIYIFAFSLMVILQPFCNAANRTLANTGANINFGFCRAMGSLAYAVLMVFLGDMVESAGINVLPVIGIMCMFFLLFTILFTKKDYEKHKLEDSVQEENCVSREKDINIKLFVKRHKMFMVVSIGVLGIYFTNAVINSYMPQIVTNVGGDNGDTGRVFALLAFMEVPTLVFFSKLAKRFSCNGMLKFSSVAFIVWVGICTVAENVETIFVAQFMQLFSFALFLPSIIKFIDDNMSEGERIKGHTLFTTITAAAAIFSSFIGGVILDISGPRMLTLISTIITVIGTIIIFIYIDKASKESKKRT